MSRRFCFLLIVGVFILAACGPGTAPVPVTSEPVKTEATPQPPNYFKDFPPEYQSIQLPPDITKVLDEGGNIVPLPGDKASLTKQLESAAGDVSLEPYDLDRVVSFTSSEGYSYIAVPVSPAYYKDNFKDDVIAGELVGLIYDQNGGYFETPDLYQVTFFDDKAVLSGHEEISLSQDEGKFSWTSQDTASDIPLTVFVKGSCYLCWSLDGRCGCLFCK